LPNWMSPLPIDQRITTKLIELHCITSIDQMQESILKILRRGDCAGC
jgi:hypothetical protein